MLAAARKSLGLAGRPNYITREYASRNGNVFLAAPWCDQAVTYWARHSGNAAAVLPKGDRAFTVWHAGDGQALGRWHAGTVENIKAHATPGCPIFFDWDGSNTIGAIDHIGVIEKVLSDGRVQTIEANTGDAVKRRVRSASVIAGFWNPDYGDVTAAAAHAKTWMEELVDKLPLLKPGAKGWAVKRAFYLLIANGFALDPKVVKDTEYTKAMQAKVAEFQKAKKLKADKEIGSLTWTALIVP
jgi:hypothetical protein